MFTSGTTKNSSLSDIVLKTQVMYIGLVTDLNVSGLFVEVEE